MLYNHPSAKIQVKFAEISFCTEEVPVEVTNVGSESHRKFTNPIRRESYRNYTLTLCNRVYLYAFELDKGSGVSYAKQLKLSRTQMLRYWGIAREVAITTLIVYPLCKVVGLILRIPFSAALYGRGI